MPANNAGAPGRFPEGDAYISFVKRRQRTGKGWHGLFLAATLVGLLSLVALLVDITNDAFGYVALQNKIDEEVLVTSFFKQKMLEAPRTLTSEDDEKLVKGVSDRANAIGFFGYSYYKNNADQLKLVSVDGVEPNATTVESGQYPLSRPLFVYAGEGTLQEKPQVAAFLGYYLANVNAAIEEVGYFPVSAEALSEAQDAWSRATGLTAETADNLAPAAGDILVVGSSTVAPITQRMADDFKTAGGASVNVQVDNIGTDAGIRAYCLDRQGDLLNASRAMIAIDLAACQKNLRQPLEFHIANDGIPIVVSPENDFVVDLSRQQLQQIFTVADNWSDIDPAWPDKPILHYIPGADSGTLDFFVSAVFGTELEDLPVESLAALLEANLSSGRVRALTDGKPLETWTAEELIATIETEIIKPEIVATWSLFESITRRQEIAAEVAAMPGADLVFWRWVNWNFLTSPQSTDPLKAGIKVAIIGSLWVTLIAFLLAVPLGVAAAIYMEEYSTGQSRFDQIVETNINNLAGVPSIIYGMLGLAVFVRILEPLTSGYIFGVGSEATANGRTIMSAGLTLGVLILPLVIINAREAIRAVPRSLREASFGLGATRWQTVWNHVLPNAISGILTGVILSVSRAFGETAPLIVVGVSTFIVISPNSPFSKYTTLPAQIYQWTSRPQEEFQHLAAAAILVLLVLLIALNATAIYLRNRYAQREY